MDVTTEIVAGTRSHSHEKGSSSPLWLLYILGTGFATVSSFFALSWPAFLSKILRSPNSPESPGAEAGRRPVCAPPRQAQRATLFDTPGVVPQHCEPALYRRLFRDALAAA